MKSEVRVGLTFIVPLMKEPRFSSLSLAPRFISHSQNNAGPSFPEIEHPQKLVPPLIKLSLYLGDS